MFGFSDLIELVISVIKAALAAVALLSLQATGGAAPHKSVYKESGTILHLNPSLRSTHISRSSTEPARYRDEDWERGKSSRDEVSTEVKLLEEKVKVIISFLHCNLNH